MAPYLSAYGMPPHVGSIVGSGNSTLEIRIRRGDHEHHPQRGDLAIGYDMGVYSVDN